MNGKSFVFTLVVLALAAVALIVLGVPSWGRASEEPDDGASDPAGMEAGSADDPERASREAGAAAAESVSRAAAIDARATSSADSAARWTYRRTAVADLDADAVPERLVVAADVSANSEGEPMWGDLHRWALYVEEDDGVRTLVYSALAPPGGLSAAVGSPGETGLRRIVVIEQAPRSARLLLASYAGPGRTGLEDVTGAAVDEWVDRILEETR